MDTDLNIRDYADDDEHDVVRLLRQLQTHESRFYDRMLRPSDLSGWYINELRKDCSNHAGSIRVAELNGTTAGYCVILTRVRNEEYDEASFEYAYVSELVVAENARKQGIGNALLADAEAISRASGSKWLRVHVLAQNALARGVYARYGFAEHLVEMEKPLT